MCWRGCCQLERSGAEWSGARFRLTAARNPTTLWFTIAWLYRGTSSYFAAGWLTSHLSTGGTPGFSLVWRLILSRLPNGFYYTRVILTRVVGRIIPYEQLSRDTKRRSNVFLCMPIVRRAFHNQSPRCFSQPFVIRSSVRSSLYRDFLSRNRSSDSIMVSLTSGVSWFPGSKCPSPRAICHRSVGESVAQVVLWHSCRLAKRRVRNRARHWSGRKSRARGEPLSRIRGLTCEILAHAPTPSIPPHPCSRPPFASPPVSFYSSGYPLLPPPRSHARPFIPRVSLRAANYRSSLFVFSRRSSTCPSPPHLASPLLPTFLSLLPDRSWIMKRQVFGAGTQRLCGS